MKLLLCAVLFGLAVYGTEFTAVMAEPNLEKRAALALKEADNLITAAKKAYDERKTDEFRARLDDVRELANLGYKSLEDTGKRARRSPKHFKRLEVGIRTLIRRLDSLSNEVSVEDRDPVTSAKTALSQVHETVLQDIMTKK